MDNNKVYIGNLPWDATKEEVQQLFGQAGTVTDVRLITDRDTGKSRGFGFVTFESDDQATRAISEFDQYEFMGRMLKVSVAENKPREKGGKRDRPRRDSFNGPRMDRY